MMSLILHNTNKQKNRNQRGKKDKLVKQNKKLNTLKDTVMNVKIQLIE